MGRARKSLALGVWMNGERVGTWRVSARGDHELHYDLDWVKSPLGRPLSISMPLRPPEVPYKGEVVQNYFDNLLPDNRQIRERIAHRFRTSTDTFELLREIGRDCVGAVQLLPENERPTDIHEVHAAPMSEGAIEKHLLEVLGGNVLGRAHEDEFRVSLAGAQEKTALLRHKGRWCRPDRSTPTTHILKLPLGQAPGGIDLRTSIENEWLCMRLLRAFGIPSAHVEIVRFGKQRVLCVERFDRRLSDEGWWMRLPLEDFAQAFGMAPNRKYEADGGPGIRQISDQLLGSSEREIDRRDFFRTQVLFWMLAAIDGHAKNFSIFIEPRGLFRLAPRYDVLSAYPVMGNKAGKIAPKKVAMAMAVWGKNRHYRWSEIRRVHLEQTGRDCGIAQAAAVIDELVAATERVIEAVGKELPKAFPATVAEPIFAGLTKASRALAS